MIGMGADSYDTANAVTGLPLAAPILAGQVPDAPWITPTDVRVASAVLAGQAVDYAVKPGPAVALADVLEMLGLVDEAGPAAWRHDRRRRGL